MRFVSKFPRLGLGTVIKEKFVLALDGQRDQVSESVSVTFSQEELTTADVAAALAVWPEKSFTGRWLDADEITQQPVMERIGVFDTERQEWDDELRERVEEWLLAKNNYGMDFIRVEAAPAYEPISPWANYENTHHKRVPTLAAELNIIDETITYERATKNRPGVLEALEQARQTPAAVVDGELVTA